MHSKTLVRALCVVLLCSASTLLGATFTPPITTNISSTLETDQITGGIDGTISGGGSTLALYTTTPITYTVPNPATEGQQNTITLSWSGTGTGQMSGSLPISYSFSLTLSNGDNLSSLNWALSFLINGSEVFSVPQTFAENSPDFISGGDTVALPGGTLNTWQANLVVNFQSLFDGDSVTIDIPYGTTIDAGPLAANSVPEPSSTALLVLAFSGMAYRLRKRSSRQ